MKNLLKEVPYWFASEKVLMCHNVLVHLSGKKILRSNRAFKDMIAKRKQGHAIIALSEKGTDASIIISSNVGEMPLNVNSIDVGEME